MLAFTLLLPLGLVCCGATAPSRRAEAPVQNLVGEVSLDRAGQVVEEDLLLDIGIQVFSAGPVDPQTAQVAPWLVEEIRAKETHYLPYVLRNTLAASNQWGAVRVLPAEDPSVALQIAGTVVHSDGLNLILQVRVWDSTGRVWLNGVYSDETSNRDYLGNETFYGSGGAGGDVSGDSSGDGFAGDGSAVSNGGIDTEILLTDPYGDLYARIANDLLAVRDSLSHDELVNISRVSQMLYAADLSPETFNRTLVTDADGRRRVVSLMAEDDPMLRRVGEMRLRHYLFIDTVDDYYQSLYAEMQPLYDLWRSYSREQILETRERAPGSRDLGNGSGIQALTQSYNRYKWARIYEQEFAGLAQGFNNEIAPAILDLNRRVHGLSGSLEEQYTQWREILRQLFELETGQELSTTE
ncbi:MAG: hypothetical protein R3F41_08140 [Gammaproteobacteria bacterium]|nr:hypothetical protein [Pseudomonadales bacterium]